MATYVFIMLITLLLISMYVLQLVGNYSSAEREMDLLTKANMLANFAAESNFEDNSYTRPLRNAVEIVGDARAIYLDAETKVLFDTSETANLVGKNMPVHLVTNALEGLEGTQQLQENDKYYITAAVPVVKNSTIIGVIYLQTPVDDMIEYLNHITHNLLILSLITIIVVGLLSFALSNIFTAPLSNITTRIKDMSEKDTRETLELMGSNEVNELVFAFNKMVEQLNLVEERRQEFVSNASHELKTPLSSLKLICDSIIQNPDMDEETIKEFLYDLNDEVDRLTRITNKLLSLTKMDAASDIKEVSDFSVINLKGMLRRILKSLRPLAEQKHITLETLLEDDVFVRVDSDKLWEAVYNIIDNSIKYTADGGWVYVEMYRDKQTIYMTVADNGIGMEEEEIEKIFDRFYRVDKARARETGGTGLGLSIARSSIELHGGTIQVESREDTGSLFRIIMPTVAGQNS